VSAPGSIESNAALDQRFDGAAIDDACRRAKIGRSLNGPRGAV
jgi:hypothetical protein